MILYWWKWWDIYWLILDMMHDWILIDISWFDWLLLCIDMYVKYVTFIYLINYRIDVKYIIIFECWIMMNIMIIMIYIIWCIVIYDNDNDENWVMK